MKERLYQRRISNGFVEEEEMYTYISKNDNITTSLDYEEIYRTMQELGLKTEDRIPTAKGWVFAELIFWERVTENPYSSTTGYTLTWDRAIEDMIVDHIVNGQRVEKAINEYINKKVYKDRLEESK